MDCFYEKRKKQNNWPVCVYMYVCVINNHHTYIVLLFTYPKSYSDHSTYNYSHKLLYNEVFAILPQKKKIQVKCRRKESNPTIKNEKPTFTINQESQNLSPTSYFNFPFPFVIFYFFPFIF